MARRGMSAAGAGSLTQVSPGAAMQNPVPQPSTPSSLNKASAPQAPQVAPNSAQKFTPQNQEDMIVMALIEQLKNAGKAKKEERQMAQGGGYGGGGDQGQYAPQVNQTGFQGTSAPSCPICHGSGCEACGGTGMMGMGGGNPDDKDMFGSIGGGDFMSPREPNMNKRSYFGMSSPSMAVSQMQGQYPF